MAVQTVQTLNHATGLNLTSLAVAADAALSDKWLGTGVEMLFVQVGTTGITITLVYGTGGTIDGQVLPNKTFVLTASNNYLMGPFPPGLFNDSGGFVNVSYTAVTNIKILPFKLGV
jgi:hypothetical protein